MGELDAVTGAAMNAHFGNPISDRLTVTEIAMLRRADTVSYTGTVHFVFQGREPSIEFIRAVKAIQATQSI